MTLEKKLDVVNRFGRRESVAAVGTLYSTRHDSTQCFLFSISRWHPYIR